MTDDNRAKATWRTRAESAFFWWRIVVTVALLAWGAWQQFVGDGVRGWMRGFLGIDEIVMRLGYIEETMPAPSVVEWQESASVQEGRCTSASCLYRLVASRTEFGDTCGAPSETAVYLRLDTGRPMRINYDQWFSPIQLGRTPEEFVVPLDIPATIPPGDYYWRSRVVYPTCAGPNEPIPRYSPWFPLTISE